MFTKRYQWGYECNYRDLFYICLSWMRPYVARVEVHGYLDIGSIVNDYRRYRPNICVLPPTILGYIFVNINSYKSLTFVISKLSYWYLSTYKVSSCVGHELVPTPSCSRIMNIYSKSTFKHLFWTNS